MATLDDAIFHNGYWYSKSGELLAYVTPQSNTVYIVGAETNDVTGGIEYSVGGQAQYFISRSQGIKGGLIGDSINSNSFASDGTTSQGWAHWGCAFHGGDITIDAANNYAVGGSTTAALDAQVTQAIADKIQVAFISSGINDLPNGIALTASLTNIKKAISRLKNAGVVPVVRLQSPRSQASWVSASISDGSGRKQSCSFNEELKAYYGNPGSGVYVHDAYPLYVDTTNATSDPRSGVTVDGLHPSSVGASLEGQPVSNLLTTAGFPLRRIPQFGPAGAFDSTYNKNGNLFNNNAGLNHGAFSTTGGTATSPVVGTVGAAFTISESGGTTAVTCSIEETPILVNGVATGATYKRQVMGATFVGGETVQVRYDFDFGSPGHAVNANDVIFAEFECEVVAAGAGGIANVLITAYEKGTTDGTITYGMKNADTNTAILPISNRGPFVIRFPAKIASGTGFITDIQLKAATGTAGAVTLKIAEPRMIVSSNRQLPTLAGI